MLTKADMKSKKNIKINKTKKKQLSFLKVVATD